MSNEAFAEHLGVAVRTVAYWRKRPDIIPQPVIQEALDVALERAPERVKEQFHLLIGQDDRLGIGEVIPAAAAGRLAAVKLRPTRLDAATVDSLAQALTGQRHLDDTMGPDLIIRPMTLQLDSLMEMLRETGGPHRARLAKVLAEWTSFAAWLHTETRQDNRAVELFRRAEELADDAGDGTIVATTYGFRAYIAHMQGNYRKAIRESAAAIATPGAHRTQQIYDMLQMAQSLARLDDISTARETLTRAADQVANAGDPPQATYWYTEPFFRLNIGAAQLAVGDYAKAADSLRSGIADTPEDQRNSEWMTEYRQALIAADDAGESL